MTGSPSIPPEPQDFLSKDFLLDHLRFIIGFYDRAGIIDPSGGYFQSFYDDGTVFNKEFKELVGSSRVIFNYATAARILDKPEYLEVAQHGIEYIEKVHWMPETKGYAMTTQNHKWLDETQYAYAYSFILLGYGAAQ